MRRILLILFLAMLLGCSTDPIGTSVDIDIVPFISQAKSADCADNSNNLHVVNNRFVVWNRSGNCADLGYAIILYGRTTNEQICSMSDSIAGPQYMCSPDHDPMFRTIIDNLDQPNLGLGLGYRVERIYF